jgi:hypothetical protein
VLYAIQGSLGDLPKAIEFAIVLFLVTGRIILTALPSGVIPKGPAEGGL